MDSTSGQMDTMRLDTAWAYKWPLGSMYKSDQYKQMIVNAYYQHPKMGRITTRNSRYDDRSPYICNWGQALGGYNFALGFGLELGNGFMPWRADDKIRLLDSMATLPVGTVVLDSLHVFALDSAKWSIQSFPVFKETWWAKDIGLVKYRLSTGETYTLESWQATPYWPLP